MSFVDNQPTPFSDDPNLLNVAISRAKERLYIVATGNEIPESSILAQLIGYCRYNNCDILHSGLRSVFDCLYKQNTLARLEYEKKHPLHGDYLSERLVLDLFGETLSELGCNTHSIIQHYRLCDLVCDTSGLNDDERAYATNPSTHIDLLLYNTITKTPALAIEIDGWHFHQQRDSQMRRDRLKNSVLAKLALPIERISTVQTVNKSFVVDVLIRHGFVFRNQPQGAM